MALRRHHAGRPALRLPAALRRGLRGLHLAHARRYPIAVQHLALLPFQRHRLGGDPLRRCDHVLQGGGHVLDQRRGRRGRNLRAVAFRRRLFGRHRGAALQRAVRLAPLDRLVHAGGHGGGHVGRDEGAADIDLPDRRAVERLRTLHPADDRRLHLVRRRLLPRPRLDLHQATAPERRSADTRQGPVGLRLPETRRAHGDRLLPHPRDLHAGRHRPRHLPCAAQHLPRDR